MTLLEKSAFKLKDMGKRKMEEDVRVPTTHTYSTRTVLQGCTYRYMYMYIYILRTLQRRLRKGYCTEGLSECTPMCTVLVYCTCGN